MQAAASCCRPRKVGRARAASSHRRRLRSERPRSRCMEEGGAVRVCCRWPRVALGPVCGHQPLALVPLETCCSDSFNIAASPRNQEKRLEGRSWGQQGTGQSSLPALRRAHGTGGWLVRADPQRLPQGAGSQPCSWCLVFPLFLLVIFTDEKLTLGGDAPRARGQWHRKMETPTCRPFKTPVCGGAVTLVNVRHSLFTRLSN